MKVEITQVAQEKLKEIMEEKGAASQSVRIYIAGFGWGGPSFGLALDEQKENDEVDTAGDIKFVVDNDVASQFNHFNIDYLNDWLRRGFYITANGAHSSCWSKGRI